MLKIEIARESALRIIRPQHFVGVLCLLIVTLLGGCGQEGELPTSPQPQPTGGVTAVGPVAGNAALHPTLIWNSLSGGSAAITYDVHFSVGSNPGVVRTGLSDTTYYVGALLPNTRYYWAITSRDSGSVKRSVVFSFTTRSTIATYPIALNNTWEYRHQIDITSQQLNLQELLYYVMEVTDVDPSWPQQPAYTMRAISADFSSVVFDSTFTYYQQADTALYLLGYDGTGGPIPASTQADLPCTFNGRHYLSVNELLSQIPEITSSISKRPTDIIVENPPLVGLRYPISAGRRWVYRDSLPWHIEKEVLGYQIHDVPAGRFGAFVIQWHLDMDDDGQPDANAEFYDYISEIGLVKRTTLLRGVEFVNPQTGRIIIADIYDVYELLGFSLR